MESAANEALVMKQSTHRGRTEHRSIQLPLSVDVVLRDLHFKTSRFSIKQLHAINWPNNFDVACFWEKGS